MMTSISDEILKNGYADKPTSEEVSKIYTHQHLVQFAVLVTIQELKH